MNIYTCTYMYAHIYIYIQCTRTYILALNHLHVHVHTSTTDSQVASLEVACSNLSASLPNKLYKKNTNTSVMRTIFPSSNKKKIKHINIHVCLEGYPQPSLWPYYNIFSGESM